MPTFYRTDTGKVCSDCREFRVFSEFNKNKSAYDGVQSLCRSCGRRRDQARKRHPDQQLRWNLKRRGITPEQRDEMTAAQGGLCLLCQRAGMRLVLDHDHSCCPYGRACPACIRGLICSQCNVALGMLRDSTDTLRRIEAYLSGTLRTEVPAPHLVGVGRGRPV